MQFRSVLTVSYLDRLAILVLGFFSSFELCAKFLGLGSLDVWLLRERNAVVPGSHDSTPTPELPVGACWAYLLCVGEWRMIRFVFITRCHSLAIT